MEKIKEVNIEKIKSEMKKFKDFYGGDLLGIDNIGACINKEELSGIIDDHSSHLEMMLSDAQSHLYQFKKRIGLSLLDS